MEQLILKMNFYPDATLNSDQSNGHQISKDNVDKYRLRAYSSSF